MDLKENKNAIIIGVISGLLVIYFFNPILSFLGNIVIRIAGRVYKSYLDSICSGIAMGEPNFSFAIYGLLFSGIFGMSVGIFSIYLTEKVRIYKGKQQNIIIDKILSPWSIYFTFIIFTITTLFLTVDGYIRFKSYVNFKQGITIVSPYISDTKNKEILSKFSLMESTEDYNKIVDEIKFIAANNKINLPKNVTSKL